MKETKATPWWLPLVGIAATLAICLAAATLTVVGS